MTNRRVLLLTDAVGGVWVYSVELARALQPLGIECVLVVMGPLPTPPQRRQAAGLKLIDSGLPLDWLETSPAELRRAAARISEIAAHEAADIIQTSSASVLAGAKFEQPCVAVQHSCVASWWSAVNGTPLPDDFTWRRELVRAGLDAATVVVAPSAAFAAETERLYPSAAPVLTVHNGRSASSIRTLPQGDFVFSAGRLWDEGKNIDTLDRAAARVAIPWQAAGPLQGPNGANVAPNNVRPLGSLSAERLAGVLAARPIFASAALYEPFGLSVLEAAQAGCALVLSDIPTHREMWDGAATFAPARDDAGFAAAIERLTGDRGERARVGRLAQARTSRFSAAQMALGMTEIYARATDSGPIHVPMAGAA